MKEDNSQLDLTCYNGTNKFHNKISVTHESNSVIENIIVSKSSFKFVQGEKKVAILSVQYN